jgi:hypothetical protein
MKRVFRVSVFVVVMDETVTVVPDEVEADMAEFVHNKAKRLLADSTVKTDHVEIYEITE